MVMKEIFGKKCEWKFCYVEIMSSGKRPNNLLTSRVQSEIWIFN